MSEGGKESLGIGQSPEIHECPQKKGSREETESEDTRAGGWDAAMGSGNPGLSKAFKEKVQKEVGQEYGREGEECIQDQRECHWA